MWNLAFEPGAGYLEDLLRWADEVDFAVLILGSDDLTTSRGETASSPRDNVVFEAGLFMGKLGRRRVFLVTPASEKLRLPSDLYGITHLEYDDTRRRSERVHGFLTASIQIRDRFDELGRRSEVRPGSQLSIEEYAVARQRIFSALSSNDFRWRNVDTLATISGLASRDVLALLRAEPQVILGVGSEGPIARLAEPTE